MFQVTNIAQLEFTSHFLCVSQYRVIFSMFPASIYTERFKNRQHMCVENLPKPAPIEQCGICCNYLSFSTHIEKFVK